MYQNTAAESRPELLVVVQEAMAIDKKFIADLIFPSYPVKTRTGDYMRIKKGSGGLLATAGSDALLRAPGTEYKAIGRTTELDGWNCKDRGLTEPIDDTIAQNLDRFFDVESSSSIFLSRNVRIAREQRVAGTLFGDIWGANQSGVKYLKANLATMDVPEDLKAAIQLVDKRQEEANTLVLSRPVWDLISISDKLRMFIFGQLQGSSMITPQLVAEKFGLKQVLIGSASFSTAKRGKEVTDADLAWCWPDNKVWVGNVQTGAPEAGGAGRTFVLEDTTSGGELLVVETYRDEKVRSDVVRVREDTDEKVVNENAGTILTVNW